MWQPMNHLVVGKSGLKLNLDHIRVISGSNTFFKMMICQVTIDQTSYNLSNDLKRGKRAGWQVNLSTWQVDLSVKWNLSLQVELVTYEKKGKNWESIARRRRRCVRDFSVNFLRVLVCLKSVFADGQDENYDCDRTPHSHHFHGTNSHEHSAHRDKQSWKNMEMKRQEHTISINRHVSPHVLSTVYCGESTNAIATLPSRSLASRCGEHHKIIHRTSFFKCCRQAASPPITSFTGKISGTKN